MRTPIHIHYNASDFVAPDSANDYWQNYLNPDSAKMFLVCADSWETAGWQPRRFVSRKTNGFNFTGALVPHVKRYPIEFWNTWFDLHSACQIGGPDIYFCTIDTINQHLLPEALPLISKHEGALSGGKMFTLSFMRVNEAFCENVIIHLNAVDAGEAPLPMCNHISDESIIREKFLDVPCLDIIDFSRISSAWKTAPLLHYSRSMVVRAMGTIPTCLPAY